MRIALCFLLLLTLAGGCVNTTVRAYEGDELPDEKVATLQTSSEVGIISIDGVDYLGGKLVRTGAAMFAYQVKPGRRRIEVSRKEVESFIDPESRGEDPRYRAVFDVDVQAGQTLYFLVEKLVVPGDITWNVWIVDRRGRRIISPTTPPQKGGRNEEIRGYIENGLPQAPKRLLDESPRETQL